MKKMLAMALSLATMLGIMAVSASAEEAPDVEGYEAITLTFDGSSVYQDIEYYIGYPTAGVLGGTKELNGYYAITSDEEITISNVGTDETAYVYVYYETISKQTKPGDYSMDFEEPPFDLTGKYFMADGAVYYLTDKEVSRWDYSVPSINGLQWVSYFGFDAYMAKDSAVILYPGESVTFKLPEAKDTIYRLYGEIYYPEHDWRFWRYATIAVDDGLVASVPTFGDVAKDAYYANAVSWAVQKGITAGTGGNNFSPNATCTDAQILTFMWNAAGSPEPTIANPFTNVKESDYYYKPAVWAYEKGMLSGTTFDAKKACSRASTVEYLWKMAGREQASQQASFNDVNSSASYAQAVSWAVENDITAGTGNGSFSPDKTCTRAQVMTFLYKYMMG